MTSKIVNATALIIKPTGAAFFRVPPCGSRLERFIKKIIVCNIKPDKEEFLC